VTLRRAQTARELAELYLERANSFCQT
jgi:hypothetical protein